MKFTHLITLKRKPWFIYSTCQEDAVNIAKRYGDNVVGVVFAPEGLIMQEVQMQVTLVNPDVKLLSEIVLNENQKIAKEVLEEDNEMDNEKIKDTKKLST